MRQVLLAASLLLPTALSAQSFVTGPPGFLTKSGLAWAWGPGAYANGRSQLADGTHRGKVMTLKGLSFRLPSPTSGYWQPGRAFTKVVLELSETSISGMSETFSKNVLRTPTKVFDKSWSLPWVTGPHRSVPAPWAFHFPFASNFVYTGARDVLADFHFSGGTLANNKAWGTNANAYLLDAPKGSTPWVYGLGRTLGNIGRTGCLDSGMVANGISARAFVTSIAYNAKDPFLPRAGRLVIEQGGILFGANTTAVTAFGFQPNTTGVPFPGVTCNRLHIGLTTPIVLTHLRTNANGILPNHYPVTGSGGVPMLPAYVGVRIVAQGAWNDTRKGNVLLSAASHTQIPPLPSLLDMAAVHGSNRVSGRGTMDHHSNPIRRYTR